MESLLTFTDRGIYCPAADVYIDPWRKVDKAILTHGHADHARWGMGSYLCSDLAAPVIRHRLGQDIALESLPFSKKLTIGGVNFSFHPAGHIIGSAQVRVEYKGEVWVVSGDYKTEDDGLCQAFEPVPCDTFITECTFGLPVYRWKDQAEVRDEILTWWEGNRQAGKVSILTGYSLGKAQRLIHMLQEGPGPIFTHGAVENVNEVLREQGIPLGETTRVVQGMKKKDFAGGLVICPPSSLGTSWMRKFQPYSVGVASGWMNLRGARRRRAVDRGFVLSDHADWAGLQAAIQACGASKVYATHGYTDIFAKYLNETGIEADVVRTEFEGELADLGEGADKEGEEK